MKILIVDDNEDSRMILKKTIESNGHAVETASNGAEALKMAKESPPDMIISDVLMPEMDGFRLCREIKQDKQLNKIPFVFYTATYVDPEDERLAMNLGASRYILKPIETNEFLNIINEVIEEYKEDRLHVPRMPLEEEHELFRMYEKSIVRKFDKKVRELKLYRQIFSLSKDAIAIINPEGFYIEQNPFHRSLIGYSDEELRGKTPAIHLGEEVFLNIAKELSEKGAYRGELISYTKNRKASYIELLAFSVVNDKGEVVCYVGIIRDITIRKQVEEKIKEESEISSSLLQIFETLNTTLDEKQLIRNVIDIIPKYLRFDRVSIFLYEQELNGFIISGSYGLSHIEEGILLTKTFKEGDFPAIDVVTKGTPAIINNAKKYILLSKDFVDMFNIGSAVLMPIFTGGKVIGMLLGVYSNVQPVRSRDIALLEGLTDGLGIALHNSRLYKESTARLIELASKVETIKAINQIDREILSAIDKNTILNTAIAMIGRVIPCERAAILIRGENIYRVIAEWGIGELHAKTFKLTGSHVDIIENSRSSLFIPDLSLETERCPYHQAQIDIGIHSTLILPLISKEGVTGIVDIGSIYPARFTPTHLSAAEDLAAQITVALEHASLYEDLQKLLINTITSFASVIDAKSPWTKGHSERVTQHALAIGMEMEFDENTIETLRLAGVLHDIGKIGTYDVILDKPGKLSPEEFGLVKQHPAKGASILEPIKQLTKLISIIKHHHERIDGQGYPDGLKGEEIPILAKILHVADAYDSMTSDRPYRKSPGKDFAVAELKRSSGTQFDSKVVEMFLRVLNKSNE